MKLTNYLLAITLFSFVFLVYPQSNQYLTWRQPHHDAQGTRYMENDPSLGTLNCGNMTNSREIINLASGSSFLPTILVKNNELYVYRSDPSLLSGVFVYSIQRNYTQIAKWAGPQVALLTMVAGDYFLYTLFVDQPGLLLYRVHLNSTVQTGYPISFPYNQTTTVASAQIAFEYMDGEGYIFIVTPYIVSAFKEISDPKTEITIAWQRDFSFLAETNNHLVGKPYVDPKEHRVWFANSRGNIHVIDLYYNTTYELSHFFIYRSIFGLSFPENRSALYAHMDNGTTWGYTTLSNFYFTPREANWTTVVTLGQTALVIDNNQVFSLPIETTLIRGSSGDSNLFYYTTNDTLFAVNKTDTKIVWTYKAPGSNTFPTKDPILIRSNALLVISSNTNGYFFHELSQCAFGTCNSKGGILAPCTCPAPYFGWACDVFCDPKLNCSGHGSCDELGSCACDGENKKFSVDLLFKFTYWTNADCSQQKIRWESVGIVTAVGLVILIIIIVVIVALVKCKRDSGYQQLPRPDY